MVISTHLVLDTYGASNLGIVVIILNVLLTRVLIPVRAYEVNVFFGLFSGLYTMSMIIVILGCYAFFEGSAIATLGTILLRLRVRQENGMR